ncbi:hypothetical protein AAVH_40262 [Aphelenchoides avenae]|nr:hypothetical protein AAVH_40262 [Aphelenchus avenae]
MPRFNQYSGLQTREQIGQKLQEHHSPNATNTAGGGSKQECLDGPGCSHAHHHAHQPKPSHDSAHAPGNAKSH